MKYTDFSEVKQQELLKQANIQTRIAKKNIEKDWWVTQVLKAIFSLPYAEHMSFKGGTSLSKAWNVIQRFSEDIDIAISREYLGFDGELSRTQVSDKLRRAACSFVREKLSADIKQQLIASEISEELFTVHVNITSVSTVDPEVVYVEYKTLFPFETYVQNMVKVEVSGRSMTEPVQLVMMSSILDEIYTDAPFAEPAFPVSVVVPERTFLEKVMLLHEEFARPTAEVRTERMSRHLYDLQRMLHTDIAERALTDEQLYRTVLEHRRKFIGLRGFDYDTLYPQSLSLEIPADVLPLWRNDYENMRRSMIYGDSVPFDELLSELRALNARIRELPYRK